jgi:hypothetical protein
MLQEKPSYYQKLSLKTSKAMKFLKSYTLKKPRSDAIISFTFPVIDAHSKIRKEKTTFESVTLNAKVVFSPLKPTNKGHNVTILGYSCGLQSSLFTKKSSLYFKSVNFLSKNYPNVRPQNIVFIDIL